MSTPSWERRSSAVVALLCALKALAHLALIARYDYHSDELYFLECGQRLALGYVDHPPLIPWIARLADASGGGIVALRLPAVLAGSATLYLGACLVREWGGQWRAQLITLLCLFLAPAPLRMTGMLDIPVIEVFLCTLTAYLVVRALKHDGRWVWGWAGAALGLAVLAKYSAVAWGLALFSGLLVSPQRHVLRARWPWLGVAVAVCVPLPNLVWQVQHGFPTLEFMSAMRAQLAVSQGRWLFLAGQVLYFAPLAVPVWIAGVAFGFRREGADARVFSVLFVALLIFMFISSGKPYYLASAYPPVLAAGGVALERWLASRVWLRRGLIAAIATTGSGLAMLCLPVLPIRELDATFDALFGWAVPPILLTDDMHRMFGSRAQTETVEGVYAGLTAEERRVTSVLAGSYSQAAAFNHYRTAESPRAVSGHMTYYLWGYDAQRTQLLVAYGVPKDLLERAYGRCDEAARIDTPLATPANTDLPVYVCRGLVTAFDAWWPLLRDYGHRPLGPE